MKRYVRLIFLLALIMMVRLSYAQDSTPTTTPTPMATEVSLLPDSESTEEVAEEFSGIAEVRVVSGFVREDPTESSEAVSSVFEDDVLEVVGRNVDGTWFEVKRPGRLFNLGWIYTDLLKWDFSAENLPMTNGEIFALPDDLDGDGILDEEDDEITLPGEDVESVVIEDTGFAVFMLAEASLRDAPFASAGRIGLIPISTTVPVLGRDNEGLWLYVNYRGTEGWISNVTFRVPANINEIPEVVVEGIPVISAPVIPVEIQLAQLEAFRAYVVSSYDVAIGLRDFWYNVAEGEVMPCEPPPFVSDYLYTSQDVQQLPELDRYAPRFNQGIEYLNASIEPLTECGVLRRHIAVDARNAATNASVIFDASLGQLDNLETIITGED